MTEEELKQHHQTLMKIEQERRNLEYYRRTYADIMDSDQTSHNIRVDAKTRYNLNVSTHSLLSLIDAEMLLIETRIKELENQLNTTA